MNKVSKLKSVVIITTVVIFHSYILKCNAGTTSDDNNDASFDTDNSVGYGEDCSNEGPFCDVRQHLLCDKIEEICVCDDKNGYVHVGHLEVIPNLFEDETENDDEHGTRQKKICIKSSDLEHKMGRLLNITKKIKNFADIMRKYQKYLPKKYQDLLKEESPNLSCTCDLMEAKACKCSNQKYFWKEIRTQTNASFIEHSSTLRGPLASKTTAQLTLMNAGLVIRLTISDVGK